MAVSEYTKYTVNRHCFFCEKISRRRFDADLFTHKWAMAVSEYTKYTVNRHYFFAKKSLAGAIFNKLLLIVRNLPLHKSGFLYIIVDKF